MKSGCIGLLVFALWLLFLLGCLFVGCCGGMFVDEDVAVKALETQGFSNVQVVEKDWVFVCFKGGDGYDNVKFTAIATNPAGKTVEVCVFAGWPFKAATVRTMK